MRRPVIVFALAILLGSAGLVAAQKITGVTGMPVGGAIGGSGTTTHLARFTAAQTIGDATVTETSGALGAVTTISMSGQLTSTLATGTAPFVVASTTQVANLYAARAALGDTVTTNANLTGPITSVGNATAVAAQTGTGSTFVMQATPTLTTPVLGVATGTSIALTAASSINANAASPPTALTGTLWRTTQADATGHIFEMTSAGTGSAPIIAGRRSAGTIASPTVTASGNGLLQLQGYGYDGSAWGTSGRANILFQAAETWSTTANGTNILIQATAPTTLTTATVAIFNSVGLALNGSSVAAFKLDVNGTGRWQGLTAAGATKNSVCIDSSTKEIMENAASSCLVSSGRYKDHVSPQGSALATIAALRPVRYRFKGQTEERLGLIAEDVAAIDPRLVDYDPQDRPHSVRYDEMVSVLAKAIQELQARRP